MSYWWLSFVDNRRPQGQRFLGATIVVAADVKDAVQEARRLGINPGGEVSLIEFPAAVPPNPNWINRLVSKAELNMVR